MLLVQDTTAMYLIVCNLYLFRVFILFSFARPSQRVTEQLQARTLCLNSTPQDSTVDDVVKTGNPAQDVNKLVFPLKLCCPAPNSHFACHPRTCTHRTYACTSSRRPPSYVWQRTMHWRRESRTSIATRRSVRRVGGWISQSGERKSIISPFSSSPALDPANLVALLDVEKQPDSVCRPLDKPRNAGQMCLYLQP